MTIFINGCAGIEKKVDINSLIKSSVPPFPYPDASVVDELTDVCPKHKCIRLYEWFGRLMIFDKQLQIYKDE